MDWKYIYPMIFTALLLGFTDCTTDQVAEPEPCEEVKTYDGIIREVVRNKCNFSGCHDGASGVGNYNTFAGMQRVIASGEFRRQVVVAKTMPQSGELTPEEFEILKCWSENGYPEN
ncbi:MAG: hypothetical protein HKN76_15280 [Saprospiraceae bacterium]|nr:hypothetical protein [Saprospiraceae bacterium]